MDVDVNVDKDADTDVGTPTDRDTDMDNAGHGSLIQRKMFKNQQKKTFKRAELNAEKARIPYRHRWALLLTQQSSITFYRLPSKETKLLLSVSVCSIQTEVCRSCFPYAKTNESCRFPLVPFYVCGNRRHGHGDMEIETQKHEDTNMDMETWTDGDMEISNENGSPCDFPLSG